MAVAFADRTRRSSRRLPPHSREAAARWRPSAGWLDPAVKAGFQRKDRIRDSAAEQRLVSDVVVRAKQGDADAIADLYRRYSDHIYSYVRVLVGDAHEAEDITQHVFAKLMTAIAKYEERQVPFWAWILRLARNEALDNIRRRHPLPVGEPRDATLSADEITWELLRCLEAALSTLPDDQRKVIVLRHIVGLGPTEIAGRLGRSPASIHGLYLRGRRNLCAELRRLDAAPATSARRTTGAA